MNSAHSARRRSGPVLSHRGVAGGRAQCCPTSGTPQVGPSAVPPRGHRVRSWLGRRGRGVTALTSNSSSRAHRPPGLRAIASLRRTLASGPRRRPADPPDQVPPEAAPLRLSPARGAVPGVAGSERVAGGRPASLEVGNALRGEVRASSRPPHLGRCRPVLGTLSGWPRPVVSPA